VVTNNVTESCSIRSFLEDLPTTALRNLVVDSLTTASLSAYLPLPSRLKCLFRRLARCCFPLDPPMVTTLSRCFTLLACHCVLCSFACCCCCSTSDRSDLWITEIEVGERVSECASTVVERNYNACKLYLLSSIAGTFGPWSRKTRISSLTNATPRLRTRRRPKGISEESYRTPVHAWPQNPNAVPNPQLRRLQIYLSGNVDGALDGSFDQLKYTHVGLPND